MNHEEFKSKFYRDGEYYIEQIPDDWGWDTKWVHCTQLKRYLGYLGMTVESWYRQYVSPHKCTCGAETEFESVSRGFYSSCSNECFESNRSINASEGWSDDRKLKASESLSNRWKDTDYQNQMSEAMTTRLSDPEMRKSIYLGKCASSGITLSHVYVAIMNDTLKFGVSHDLSHRMDQLNAELIYNTRSLPVEDAATLECAIATNFKSYLLDNERLPLGIRESVIKFIMENI